MFRDAAGAPARLGSGIPFDLVMTDVVMPDLARAVRSAIDRPRACSAAVYPLTYHPNQGAATVYNDVV